MTIKTAKEIANGTRSNAVASPISLCLYIDSVQSKRILIDYAVYSIVTRTTQGPASIIR